MVKLGDSIYLFFLHHFDIPIITLTTFCKRFHSFKNRLWYIDNFPKTSSRRYLNLSLFFSLLGSRFCWFLHPIYIEELVKFWRICCSELSLRIMTTRLRLPLFFTLFQSFFNTIHGSSTWIIFSEIVNVFFDFELLI